MSVVVEPTFIHHRRLQRILAGVAEGWMADIVREAQRLGQILVEPERSRDRPPDLRDFEAVRQPDAKMVAVGRSEEHTSELQSLMRISYAVFCWKKQILITAYK